MPMEQRAEFPVVLKRLILRLFLAGLLCAAVSVIISILSQDGILLILGFAFSGACLCRALSLFHRVLHKQLAITEGICHPVSGSIPSLTQQIRIDRPDKPALWLSLSPKAAIAPGGAYRFYFTKDALHSSTPDLLSQLLPTEGLLGFEEISPSEIEHLEYL